MTAATRGRPRRLDEGEVVAAALRVVDRGGAAALSVRGVAQELGVAPNAVYTYFADRDALERAVVEQVLETVDVGVLAGPARSWRARIRRYCTDVRAAVLAHPGAAALFMTAPMDGPAALASGEGLLAALRDGGASPADAARGVYLLIVYVIGSAALEAAETDGRPPLAPEADRIRERAARLQHVDATSHPLTAASAEVFAGWIGTPQFTWGVDVVLDGVAARARRR